MCQFMPLGHLQGLNWGPADPTWIYCYSLSFRAKSLKPESVTAWLCSSLTWTKTCNTCEPKVYTCRLGATENNYRATISDFYVLQFLSNDWKLISFTLTVKNHKILSMAFILVLNLSCIYLYEVLLIYHEKKRWWK